MNRDEAIKATKNGAIAACISGSLTLIIVLIAISSNSSGGIALWNDPSNFFDIILIFGCAFGVYKKSRAAAVILFVYFILAKVLIGIETGKVSGVGVALVFLYFYGKAIQGAFVFHKIEKAENPEYNPAPRWVYFTGIPLLILFAVMVVIGLLTMTSVMPSTEVQAGSKVFLSDKKTLIASNIISEDDTIQYFYSSGFTSILEGGSILTDNRIILYLPDENQEIEIYELYFNEIASVELISDGNSFNDSVYKITSHDPDAWLKIALSVENRGDIKFVEALRSSVGKNNP